MNDCVIEGNIISHLQYLLYNLCDM